MHASTFYPFEIMPAKKGMPVLRLKRENGLYLLFYRGDLVDERIAIYLSFVRAMRGVREAQKELAIGKALAVIIE